MSFYFISGSMLLEQKTLKWFIGGDVLVVHS